MDLKTYVLKIRVDISPKIEIKNICFYIPELIALKVSKKCFKIQVDTPESTF